MENHLKIKQKTFLIKLKFKETTELFTSTNNLITQCIETIEKEYIPT